MFPTVKTDLKKIEQRLSIGPRKIAIFGIFEKIMFFWSKIFFKRGILTMTETIRMVKKMGSRPLNQISFLLKEK